jgi:hypothetical protein
MGETIDASTLQAGFNAAVQSEVAAGNAALSTGIDYSSYIPQLLRGFITNIALDF